MARAEERYQCISCGGVSLQWSGRCPECGDWNTIRREEGNSGQGSAAAVQVCTLVELSSAADEQRITVGLAELDRVLGGGIVRGGVALIGGDPGMGKSTLLLQALAALSAQGVPALYVTGEESLAQVAQRAARLGLKDTSLGLVADNELGRVMAAVRKANPAALVIDSIQTLYDRGLSAVPGGVIQLRECAATCVRMAKQDGVAVFLIGHVTKEGVLAGPRVLEHIVDTVLYFEGDPSGRHRLLRATKNRYGAVNELGVFAMTDRGLRGVDNPSALFLARPDGASPPGSAVMVTREGTRPLLIEVQALVDDAQHREPRRLVTGLASGRLDMLLAVLNRHGGLETRGQDVFVNVVGGVRVVETAADLPVLLAIASSLRNRPLPSQLVSFGEVGLSGEVRPVPGGLERMQEALRHGYTHALVPQANSPKRGLAGMQVATVGSLAETLAHAALI